jgi:hypothetical protein
MSAGWTLVLLLVGAVIAVGMSWRRRVDTAELGAVSARWIAEQRATDSHYTGR